MTDSTLSLRPMRESDIDAVYEIECASQFHPWSKQEFLNSLKPHRRAWVIEQDSQVCAFAVFGLLAGECELLTIACAANARRKGFAKTLIEHAFKEINPESIFLEVRASNTSAQALYEQLDFHEVGLRKNYYPAENNKFEDALIMVWQNPEAELTL
ncbi:ribosomal protein S18-alanine N-acetyltransferase [Sessilibacter sp. MAH4]